MTIRTDMRPVLAVPKSRSILDAHADQLLHTLHGIWIFAVVHQAADVVHLLEADDEGKEEIETVLSRSARKN
jgi:hypothetical protein